METMSKIASASQKEGKLAKTIEEQTSKLPSDVFLWLLLAQWQYH